MTEQPENALLAAEAEIARLTEERDQHWDADRAEIARLRAQRDQLLAALIRCEAMVSTKMGPPNWDQIRSIINDALKYRNDSAAVAAAEEKP